MDFSRLYDLTGGRETFLVSLLKKIKTSTETSPQEIKALFQQGNQLATRELAHKFKSSVMYLNHKGMNEAIEKVEYSNETGLSPKEIEQNINAIISFAEEIILAVQNKIDELQ